MYISHCVLSITCSNHLSIANSLQLIQFCQYYLFIYLSNFQKKKNCLPIKYENAVLKENKLSGIKAKKLRKNIKSIKKL